MRAEEIDERSYYFDLPEFERRAIDHSTTNTPAVSLLYALQHQLRRIGAEGLEARFERHARMASRTREWVDWLNEAAGREFSVIAPEGYRSPTVTAIRLPGGFAGPDVVAGLAARGITIAPGYGKMKQGAIRIGHMGDHTPSELEIVLAAVADVLDVAGPAAPTAAAGSGTASRG